MVDLARDDRGRARARLLDLVPTRSKRPCVDWLQMRTPKFRDGVGVAALHPFADDKSAIDDELGDAAAVLDAFRVVKLGTRVVDEVRRRVQQDTVDHEPAFRVDRVGIRIRHAARARARRLCG